MQEVQTILNDVSDINTSLTSLLVRTKILAKQLQNQELLNWVEVELKGYHNSADEVPNYRMFRANLTGTVSIPGQQIKNLPLPTDGLSKEMKIAVYQFRFRESVENLEKLSKKNSKGSLEYKFEADAIRIWESKLRKNNPNLSLLDARRTVPITAIDEVLASIRHTLFDNLLAIEDTSVSENQKIKNDLKSLTLTQHMDYKYDVALSFAGEDRVYVDKVAAILRENKVRVFYDKFEEVDLWGKDLGVHFDYVYRRSSKYFIPFISINYKEKVWTTYEVRNAIARAVENREEYILPARFDKTELDGIRSTLGYIDISKKSPEDFAKMIIAKLSGEINVPLPEKEEPKGDIYLYAAGVVSVESGITGINIGVNVVNIIKENRYYDSPYFKISEPIEGSSDTFHLMSIIEKVNFPTLLEYGQPLNLTFYLSEGFLKFISKYRQKGVTISAFIQTTVGEKFKSNELNVDELFKE